MEPYFFLPFLSLMFTDNDELSGLIAEMTKSQCLIILSNIDGFYTGNPSESDSHLIRVVNRGCDFSQYIQKTKSTAGRGGMQSKYCVASRLASSGIGVVIANGKRENILLKVMTERDTTPCTEFLC